MAWTLFREEGPNWWGTSGANFRNLGVSISVERECVEIKDRFKVVDDLSFLEIIYLVNIGIASYNIHAHVLTTR